MYRPGVNVDPWYENFKFFLTYWLLSNNRDRIGDVDPLPPPPPPPPNHTANPFLSHKPTSAPHLKASPTLTSWDEQKHQASSRQHSLQDSYNDLSMKTHISPNGHNGTQQGQNNPNNSGFPPSHMLGEKDRRHVCPHCYKGFRSRQQLNQHNLVHSGLRKYHCLYCERAFKQLSHVQQHHRIHTGEKPYKCPLDGCDKAFAQMSNLQHHMRQHDKATFGQKHCMCPFCDRGYASEKSLKSHISKMHPDSKLMDFTNPGHPLLGSPQTVPGMSPRHSLPTMHPSMKSSLSPSGVSLGQGGPLELTVNSMGQDRKSVQNEGRRYSLGNNEKFSNEVSNEMKLLQRSLSERSTDPNQDARNFLFDQRYGLSNNGHDMNKVGRPYDPFPTRISQDLKQLTGKGIDMNEEKFQRMAEEFNDFRARISMAPIHHFNRKDQMMSDMFGEHLNLNDRPQQVSTKDLTREQILFAAANMNTQRYGDAPVNSRNYDLQVGRPNGIVMNRQSDINQLSQFRLNTDQDSNNINRQNDDNIDLRNNNLRLDSRNEVPLSRPESLHRPYHNQDEVCMNQQNETIQDNTNVGIQNGIDNGQDKMIRNKLNSTNDDIILAARSNMGSRQGEILNGHQGDMMNSRQGDVMNGRHGDVMNGHQGDVMNGRQDVMNGRQGDIMTGRQSDMMSSHHGEMLNGHQGDMTNGRPSDLMTSRQNELMNGHRREMMNGRNENLLNNRSDEVIMGGTSSMDDLIMTSPIQQSTDRNVIGMNSQIGINGNQSNSLSPRNLLQNRQPDIKDIAMGSEPTTSHAHDMRISSHTPITNNTTNIGIMSRNTEMNLSHENLNMNSQQQMPSRHTSFDQVSQNGPQRMNGIDTVEVPDVNAQMDFGESDEMKRLSNGSQNGDSNIIRQRKRKPSNPQHVFMPSIDHYTSFPTEEMEDCSGLIIDVENNPGYENKMTTRVDMREPMNCN